MEGWLRRWRLELGRPKYTALLSGGEDWTMGLSGESTRERTAEDRVDIEDVAEK